MKALLLTTAAAAAFCLIAFTHLPPSDIPTADPVDEVLGEGGFNLVYPVVPGNGIPHQTQITHRLIALEMLLRQRDVTSWPAGLRAERARNLDRLHQYRLAASYPRNYDRPSELLPCFIDRDGRICAVGYLVEQSAGHGFAEKINARHQYETIAQMHEPELDRWIARSGLTRAEVETIQVPEPAGSPNRGFAQREFTAEYGETGGLGRIDTMQIKSAAQPQVMVGPQKPTVRPTPVAVQPQPQRRQQPTPAPQKSKIE